MNWVDWSRKLIDEEIWLTRWLLMTDRHTFYYVAKATEKCPFCLFVWQRKMKVLFNFSSNYFV